MAADNEDLPASDLWLCVGTDEAGNNQMELHANVFSSQLQVRKALQFFATLHEDDSEFPVECECWRNIDWWKLLDKSEYAVRPLS